VSCPEKQSLIEKYERAASAYWEAVRNMRDGANLPLAEFEVAYNFAVQVSEGCLVSRHALLSHGEEHGCVIWPAA